MDSFMMESHKLMYHPERLAQWLRTQDVYPLYVEIGLSGGCNHRCVFCAFDFLRYAPAALDGATLKRFLAEASSLGVRSILYSGEGEPLLNPDACAIVAYTRQKGIDAALSTNGVLLDREKSARMLRNLTWVRVSLNAGTRKTYSRIHQAPQADFDTVLANLEQAVRVRDKNRLACTIGVQFLLIPQNRHELIPLARALSGIGVDYLSVKPYAGHPSSHKRPVSARFYERQGPLEKALAAYEQRGLRIIVRRHAMEKLSATKPYRRCLGLTFHAHIDAHGDVYPCNFFVGRKQYSFGNIKQQGLGAIWKGKRRGRIMATLRRRWDVDTCRYGCRLDEINRFLWELQHPHPHVNFI